MRNFKFRAWDKRDKVMYCDVQKGIIFDDGSYYEFRRFLGHQELDDYHKWELMSCTGQKDSKGKYIYEGDILRIYLKEDCILDDEDKEINFINVDVFWNDETGCWDLDSKDSWREIFGEELYNLGSPFEFVESDGYKSHEVVGNIYETEYFIDEWIFD